MYYTFNKKQEYKTSKYMNNYKYTTQTNPHTQVQTCARTHNPKGTLCIHKPTMATSKVTKYTVTTSTCGVYTSVNHSV